MTAFQFKDVRQDSLAHNIGHGRKFDAFSISMPMMLLLYASLLCNMSACALADTARQRNIYAIFVKMKHVVTHCLSCIASESQF